METNLRCGKCGELICARCLVQTPVGARCADCAAERKNPVFDPSASEMGRAWVAAVVAGVVIAVVGWILAVQFPAALSRYVYILAPAAAGWIIGSVAYRASGHKRSRRLQMATGGATLLSFVLMTYLIGVMTLGSFIGLAVGTWYALGAVKPPRGA